MSATKVVPGPKGHFWLGSAPEYRRDAFGFLTGCARTYGDAVRFRLGPLRCIMFSHPELIEEVLRVKNHLFIKDLPLQRSDDVFGQGLLTSEGDFWRKQRRLIQPAFLQQQVQGYAEVMVDSTLRWLETWHDGQTRDLHKDLTHLTLDIVARTLFHADLSGRFEQLSEAVNVLSARFLKPFYWTKLGRALPLPENLRFWRALRLIDGVIERIVQDRRTRRHDPGDVLSRLLNAQREPGGTLTDRQIRDEAITLFLAGHETTALALGYSFYLMAKHPEVEAKLLAELDEILAGRPPTAADLPRLRYTEWVIKESMRVYPPAWGLGREATCDLEIGGYFVPKGTQVLTIQWVVHHDPRWYDEPEAFRPERWDNDLEKRLPRCAYFPFGEGPRICVGGQFAMTEAILVLATVVPRFRLRLASDRLLKLIPSITMRPKDGLAMIIEERPTRPPREETTVEVGGTSS